jgi:uncharacterized protein
MSEKAIDKWRGKWALVTGASSGIGAAIAAELAAGGANLVLTARRRERLDELSAELARQHSVKCEVFVSDLEQPSAPEAIFAFARDKGIEIALLVNNAGFGAYGEFAHADVARQLAMVQVNVAAMLHLTHLFLQPMVARRSGDILILGSTAAFQPVPYISTYAATKAFDLFFAQGLAEEVADFGIHVCALCPGSTSTEFHQVAGQTRITAMNKNRETAEKVAHVGLKALAEGKSMVISGAKNLLGVEFQRLAPRRFVTRTAAKLFKPAEANPK